MQDAAGILVVVFFCLGPLALAYVGFRRKQQREREWNERFERANRLRSAGRFDRDFS